MNIEEQIAALLAEAEPLRLLPDEEAESMGLPGIVDMINALRAEQSSKTSAPLPVHERTAEIMAKVEELGVSLSDGDKELLPRFGDQFVKPVFGLNPLTGLTPDAVTAANSDAAAFEAERAIYAKKRGPGRPRKVEAA